MRKNWTYASSNKGLMHPFIAFVTRKHGSSWGNTYIIRGKVSSAVVALTLRHKGFFEHEHLRSLTSIGKSSRTVRRSNRRSKRKDNRWVASHCRSRASAFDGYKNISSRRGFYNNGKRRRIGSLSNWISKKTRNLRISNVQVTTGATLIRVSSNWSKLKKNGMYFQ